MTVTLNIAHKKGPREHLMFSDHLTEAKFDTPIRETFLGQAHIAGTGPEGKTCRECEHWHQWKFKKLGAGLGGDWRPTSPGYNGKRHKTAPLEPKKAYCNRPILNKAKRLIPHFAKACRLFVAAEHPMAAKRPE